jgi:hypothetical protein
MFTKVSGSMIKLMAAAHMSIWMEHNTPVNGERINSMVSVLKHGQMVPNMRATMNTARNMEQALSSGRMVLCI